MKILNKNYFYLPVLLGIIVFSSSCSKDYYKDSGTHPNHYNETVLEYLESKPAHFDSLVKIIKYAGMENIFENNEITFFAPDDSSIINSIQMLNQDLYTSGLDTVSDLMQISPDIWKSELSMYIFEGKHLLEDYPQLDLLQIQVFPGQNFQSYGGRTMNIGVIYGDAGDVQYAGYRQLALSYIPSLSAPQSSWYTAYVSSSNIQLNNGVVHDLQFGFHVNQGGTNAIELGFHFFGFSLNDFISKVMETGLGQ